MWIGRAKWEWLKETRHRAEQRADDMFEQLKAEHRSHARTRARLDELHQREDAMRAEQMAAKQAIREASLLRARLNTVEMERAALLTRLLPGLEIQVPQFGQLDVTLGAPGTDFDDLGDLSHETADAHPLSAETNRETIADELGVDDAMQRGQVIRDVRRPPTT